MESLFETRVQNQKRWSFGPLFGSQIPLFAVLPQEETTTLLSLIMMLVTVILHVTVILLYLRLRFPPRLSDLVTIFSSFQLFFESIAGYEVQSTHTKSASPSAVPSTAPTAAPSAMTSTVKASSKVIAYFRKLLLVGEKLAKISRGKQINFFCVFQKALADGKKDPQKSSSKTRSKSFSVLKLLACLGKTRRKKKLWESRSR